MPKNSLVRRLSAESLLPLCEAARKFQPRRDPRTLSRWITEGRARKSDGLIVKLEAIKGPDGGWLTSEPANIRFLEKLNGGLK